MNGRLSCKALAQTQRPWSTGEERGGRGLLPTLLLDKEASGARQLLNLLDIVPFVYKVGSKMQKKKMG